jgi:spore coat protein CotH
MVLLAAALILSLPLVGAEVAKGKKNEKGRAAITNAVPDEAGRFFGLEKLWTMELQVSAADWEAMEPVQTEGGGPPRGPGRMQRDYPEVPCVVLWEDRSWTNATVRFKGNSSFNFARDSIKRSLKLDFNDREKGGRFLGMTKLNLNNNTMDASLMQEAIAYDLFRRAGIPASRTAFVKVFLTVPGRLERRYAGLYTAVEQVDDRFLDLHFGSGEGLLLKPEGPAGVPYFGNAWKSYASVYDPKTTPSNEDKARLMAFARFVNQSDAETFRAGITNHLEVDAFLRFLALNAVLANHDSCLTIGHNYYLHLDPSSGRFRFLPWDLNHAFGKFPMVGNPTEQMNGRFLPPNPGRNPLIDRLLEDSASVAAYRQHVESILRDHFQPARLKAQVESIASLLRDSVKGDPLYTPEEFERAIHGPSKGDAATPPVGLGPQRGRPGPGMRNAGPCLLNWIEGRAAAISAQLAGTSEGGVLNFNPGRPGGPRPGFPGGPRGFGGPPGERQADPDGGGPPGGPPPQ